MGESMIELFKSELAHYKFNGEPLNDDDKRLAEEEMKALYDNLFYSLNFDDRVVLIQLTDRYKQLSAQKEKDAFIKGFSLALTYFQK